MISAIKDSKRIFSQNGGGGANGLNYKGTWDANLNNPFLASGVGIQGDYYVVSVAGNTTLDGVTSWDVSDWAIFNGTVWQKIDNTVYVPYSGATGDVDLGEYELKAGQIEFDQSPTGTFSVATTRWNNTDGLSETLLKGGNVTLKNGSDLVARVVNNTGIQLTKAAYQVVKVSGAQGQRLAVQLAQANNDNNSADTLGIAIETINNNLEGFIMTMGQIVDINTTGSLQGETWADGNVLYLSPTTPGAITNVKPTGATGHIVIIGYVEHAHITHGKIFVKIMNGWELDELHNVYINPGTLANNDALIYESATQLWKNKTIPTALGYTPENVSNKSDSYTVSSTITYANTKALVDGLATKKTIATGNAYKFETTDASGNLQETTVTASRAVVTDANGLPSASATTATEIGYVSGVSSAIQTQLNSKEVTSNKSTDTNLGTSNTLYPTQNAVKVYADNLLGNANALVYKGVIDCSGNPNYPAANAGEMYIASVAGKIGGVSGIDVEVGDMIICNTDSTPSGDQATVGAYWNIIQKNIIGAVTGPASSTNNNVAFFDGVTGKVIKDSGITLSGTNTGDQTLSGLGGVPTTRTVSTTSPLSGGGDLSADRTLSIADAVADGATKGAAAFTTNDFNSASGVISIDYANGQKASSTQDGFLSSANWSTFNGKQDALGFTPEDVSNKKTTMTGNTTSNVFYLTAKAIYDWATGLFVQTTRNLTVNGTSADLSADRTFTVTDANLSTSDVTTNDVSITKHGFAPKAPNDATKYLDGTGAWSIPAGGGGGAADILQFQVFS